MTRDQSIGSVTTEYFTFAEDEPFCLQSGAAIGPVTLAYETYGKLNADRSNAILICHALSGSAHAAGYLDGDPDKLGWWDDCIGPGKAFDTSATSSFAATSSAVVMAPPAPSPTDPATGKPYGLHFPVVTIATWCAPRSV